MKIETQAVKQLRDQTGAGVMDVKNALEASKGDAQKALEILKQKGQAKATKRAGRATAAGLIDTYLHMGRVGTLVEVNCETDFVAKTAEFKDFVHMLTMQVASMRPLYLAPEGIPAQKLKEVQAGFKKEAQASGKPEAAIAKITKGKVEKFYQETCLLKQPSIMDPSQTIEAKLQDLIGTLGENIVIKRFERYELGES